MNGIEASHADLNEKLARAIDPNDKYSLDDFDKEFGSVNHTLSYHL